LIKGGDYTTATVIGADVCVAHGRCVGVVELLEGRSTSELIARIFEGFNPSYDRHNRKSSQPQD
jgi:D-beta-D-heptose 7-phosphate kinase/D-beta-D-heptose 1-phosphate adenosyltransferase